MENYKYNKQKMLLFKKEVRQYPVYKQVNPCHSYRQKIKVLNELCLFNDFITVCYDVEEIPYNPEKNMPPYSIPEKQTNNIFHKDLIR